MTGHCDKLSMSLITLALQSSSTHQGSNPASCDGKLFSLQLTILTSSRAPSTSNPALQPSITQGDGGIQYNAVLGGYQLIYNINIVNPGDLNAF